MEANERMARAIVLSHFPTSTRVENWQAWPALKSATARAGVGVAVAHDPARHPGFAALDADHVFTFAGPVCFTRTGAVGNAAVFFGPEAEAAATGGASPFDTGALETGRIRPWNHQSQYDRWDFHQSRACTLPTWRTRFAAWLADSYGDNPWRYLDTTPDRDAGQPDRLDPDTLRTANGALGRKTGDRDCADRRAWTWEVRFFGELPMRHAAAILIPASLAERATAWCDSVEDESGARPAMWLLANEDPGDPDTLYAASGPHVRRWVETR